MSSEAKPAVRITSELIDLSECEKLGEETFIKIMDLSRRLLPRLHLASFVSWGFAGAFLITGGMVEDTLMVGIGGISLYFANRLHSNYLKAKLTHTNLETVMADKRYRFELPDGSPSDFKIWPKVEVKSMPADEINQKPAEASGLTNLILTEG